MVLHTRFIGICRNPANEEEEEHRKRRELDMLFLIFLYTHINIQPVSNKEELVYLSIMLASSSDETKEDFLSAE
jgi:hypothetical protein